MIKFVSPHILWQQEAGLFYFGFWILDFGFWILDCFCYLQSKIFFTPYLFPSCCHLSPVTCHQSPAISTSPGRSKAINKACARCAITASESTPRNRKKRVLDNTRT
ncbi:hypothetical protein SR1949_17350 [Sphaerospermopsis reniformis]|uniref:Uncharacterized protein n=1 Tax=Sphaerospermopsis reniformis TaxID=531300 RepID=A0A479ZVC5_9CYAN|nr:hypothetical protein SR1949_17350 [Sphaerospermopsis reniformis]